MCAKPIKFQSVPFYSVTLYYVHKNKSKGASLFYTMNLSEKLFLNPLAAIEHTFAVEI